MRPSLRQFPETARHAVVAIPARNEADWIARCLLALAAQTRAPDVVLLLLNNCTDGTEAIARTMSPHLPYRLRVQCRTFPPTNAHAGSARRLAMQSAARLAGSGGVLLTTDADTVVANDWVERNLAVLSAGADLVCGQVTLDPAEAAMIPQHVHDDDALECTLTELLDRMAARLDPEASDPWPRHTEVAGASLAVTVAAFKRVGGMPAAPSGEDRAFARALMCIDARIRHDPAVKVTVSGRIDGRAPGGMADTIRRRMQHQDEFTDASLEPAVDAWRRIDFRRRARLAWHASLTPRALGADLGIARSTFADLMAQQYFGAVWADIEARSPFLLRRRVRFADLRRQIAYAHQLLQQQALPEVT